MGDVRRRDALCALENLTDTVLNADRVFSAEFLFNAFSEIFPSDLDFAVVLREGRRFIVTEQDHAEPYLNFNFLSFQWLGGRLLRFSDKEEIDSCVARYGASPDFKLIEQEKLLCFVPKDVSSEDATTIKAAARCLGVFYYTCGSYDHFITNVAARFVKDYFKRHKQFEVEDIVKAVQDVCRVRVAYLNTVSTAAKVNVVSDPTNLYASLENDPSFADDLQKSFRGRVTIVGQTTDNVSYSIHTLSHEYFDHSRPLMETAGQERGSGGERYFTRAPRGVVITAIKDNYLRLDVLSLAPRIFRAYVNDRIFSAREEFFYGLLRDGGKLADQLLVEPAATGEALRRHLYPLLDKACSVLVQLTFASSVAIRAYDPFDQCLIKVGASRQRELNAPEAVTNVPLGAAGDFASARAYAHQKSVGLSAQRNSERDDAEIEPAPASLDFGGEVGHVASIPIKVGAIILGTLDFFTSDRKFFSNDRQYLEIAAGAIGELIRRVEAANDSAWLSRLSFLHSARHDLGRFERDLEHADAPLAARLHEILQQYSSLDDSFKDVTREGFEARIRSKMKFYKLNDEQIDAFLAPIKEVFAGREVPSLSLLLFQEVFENLLHNARAHSNLNLADFDVRYLGIAEGPPSAVMIRYRAEGSPRSKQILERLCVSPIQEGATSLYHYGLFLLASQLRMAGGYAAGRRDGNPMEDAAPFDVTFGIPLI